MKRFFFILGLSVPALCFSAQVETVKKPLFSWDLLWAGSWEESRTLHNRGDFRFDFIRQGLLARGQALDRRTLNFKLDSPWGDPSSAAGGASFGLYHKGTGSRLLYGVLDEWGLPARIRSPWIRSAPYAENHKPVMADLRTSASVTKSPEAYLYLSSPRFTLFEGGPLPETSIRGFASAQMAADTAAPGEFAPAFAGGLEAFPGKKAELLLEGFYTGRELPARGGDAWFSDPPPLPARDFRLGAASMAFGTPYFSLTSDWAWSETFAWGRGVYGSAGMRFTPPPFWNAAGNTGKPGRWSLSAAADGMGERYIGRDGASPGGGFRTAGKIEWKGPRSSLFRVNTVVRGPGPADGFDRSSTGIYYRFPASSGLAASAGNFPLRVSRVSLNADRNGSDRAKITDSVDGTLGLSLSLPPMLLPPLFLPASAKSSKSVKPKIYPLSVNLTASLKGLGSTDGEISPYPFSLPGREFDSSKTSCELLWSPGIFQFRTKWGFQLFAEKDSQWEGSFSAAVRFRHGRFSVKMASPVFPEKWNCTLSWRVER